MTRTVPQRRKPRIVVCDTDHERLTGLAETLHDRNPEVADELLAEMERARIVSATALPADAVRMGSRVAFRSDGGQEREVVLVYPGEADIAEGKISIMTPIGTALIGLTPGQSISWVARDGRRHELEVLSVAQPQAAG